MRKYILIPLLTLVFTFSCLANERNKFTISGISSGGFMANQMSTIFSSQFSGIATAAGGFYFCAGNYLQNRIKADAFGIGANNLFLFEPTTKILTDTMNPFLNSSEVNTNSWFAPSQRNPTYQAVTVCMGESSSASLPLDYIKSNAAEKLIDHPSFLAEQKAFIYQGKIDSVINFDMQAKLKEYYLSVGLKEQNIVTMEANGNHNFPTDRTDELSCMKTGVPYVASCELNLAEKFLKFLFEENIVSSVINKNHIHIVDQTLNLANLNKNESKWSKPVPSVAPYGYLYASDKCLNHPEACRLHVALHGCAMSDSFNEDFQTRYKAQVQKFRIVSVGSNQAAFPVIHNPFIKTASIEENTPKYGLLKFVMDSGYINFADQNDLMILFPQTWVSADNFPYNPTGCWDWFGWTGEDYATNKGSEAQWMIAFINSIAAQPMNHILNKKPNFEDVEKNFPR
jgi:hypothetical protein